MEHIKQSSCQSPSDISPRFVYHPNEKLTYSQFLSRTISISAKLTDKYMVSLFQYLNCDSSGRISHANIDDLLLRKLESTSAISDDKMAVKHSQDDSGTRTTRVISHQGMGYDTFSEYMLQLSPSNDRTHHITSSDNSFYGK